jgi:hypothetical protein
MISALALAFLASVRGSALPLEIPRPFWGEYNERLADCGTGNNDSRLRISRDRLQFYESTGVLRELIQHRDGSVTIVSEQTGEGQTSTSVYHLRLLDSSNTLTITHPQTRELVQTEETRHRCPSGRNN